MYCFYWTEGFPGGSDGKESTCNLGDLDLIPGLGMTTHSTIPAWRIPMDKRSLAGYSQWGCKELDRTEQLTTNIEQNIYDFDGIKESYVLRISEENLSVWGNQILFSFYHP